MRLLTASACLLRKKRTRARGDGDGNEGRAGECEGAAPHFLPTLGKRTTPWRAAGERYERCGVHACTHSARGEKKRKKKNTVGCCGFDRR